jgi:ribonuclease P protein component
MAAPVYSSISRDPEINFTGSPEGKPKFFHFFLRPTGTPSRFAVIVPRRWDKAARRNRTRRVLREILRDLLPDLNEGMDLLVFPRAGLKNLGHTVIKAKLKELLKELKLVRTG